MTTLGALGDGSSAAAATLLTGFSGAESGMVQAALKALQGAGYDTSPLAELIRADMPIGYAGMSLDNGAALGQEAFSSQAMLNHTLEEELIHYQQSQAGLRGNTVLGLSNN